MPCEYWWFILGWQLSYLLLLLLSSDLQAIPFIAFWSCWECQINETNYFGQIFFLSREILLTSRPNYTVLTPVSKTSSLGATFLIESFILPTLNKLFKKSRLMPYCKQLYLKWIAAGQIECGSDFCGWHALEFTQHEWQCCCRRGIQRCSWPVQVLHCSFCQLTSLQTLQQPKGSSGAWGERGYSTMEQQISWSVFSVLPGAYLVPSVQGSLYQQLSVLLNAV